MTGTAAGRHRLDHCRLGRICWQYTLAVHAAGEQPSAIVASRLGIR
ncbi:MAG: hypothetical protein ABIP57_08820 [Jatrophihabitantaceae bacterium]